MNILVTGAKGQLGCSLQKISIDYPQHSFVYTDIPEMDITDKNQVIHFIQENKIDVIINCAAYTAVDKAEEEKEVAEKINTIGPKVLAEIAKENNISLIHISTDYVFDGESYQPLKENNKTNPSGIYGKTKLASEIAIKETGCNATIIRTSWLYSEFGNNFVKTMLRLGKERDRLNIVYDQIGTPTYATDLAKAIIAILEKNIKGYELYHYSNEGVASWYDFTKEVFSISGINISVSPIESDQYPTLAKRPFYSVLSKDKIKEKGIEVPYWKDSLKACLSTLNEMK